jgi:hypothetical protein
MCTYTRSKDGEVTLLAGMPLASRLETRQIRPETESKELKPCDVPFMTRFTKPTHVACDSRGYLFVSDYTEQRIVVLSPNRDERVVMYIGSHGSKYASLDGGFMTCALDGPGAMALDRRSGALYIGCDREIRCASPSGGVYRVVTSVPTSDTIGVADHDIETKKPMLDEDGEGDGIKSELVSPESLLCCEIDADGRHPSQAIIDILVSVTPLSLSQLVVSYLTFPTSLLVADTLSNCLRCISVPQATLPPPDDTFIWRHHKKCLHPTPA